MEKNILDFEPEIIYYYGNVLIEHQKAFFIFEDEQKNIPHQLDVLEFSNWINNLTNIPIIIYLNICNVSKRNLIRPLISNLDYFPAIIIGHETINKEVLQKQAISLFKSIFFNGDSPHKAINKLILSLNFSEFSDRELEISWPHVISNYHEWLARPITISQSQILDPLWYLKVNRDIQISLVKEKAGQMVLNNTSKSLIFSWYGMEGQGIEIFQKRLEVELQKYLKDTLIFPLRPEWPIHLENRFLSFREMFHRAFEINSLEEIPSKLNRIRLNSGKKANIGIHNEP